MSIESLVEKYDEGLSSKMWRILRGAGIVSAFLGWLCLLWIVPDGLIRSWLGEDREFANWATVVCVLILFYYGSESFSLTFAGGFFMLGCLLGIRFLFQLNMVSVQMLIGIFFIVGYALLFATRISNGSAKTFYRDFLFLPVMPVWIFRFIYRWMGISF